MAINFTLHAKQAAVLRSIARFIVFGAGRRSGKTWLAAVWLYLQAMAPEREGVNYGPTSRILYVAPTLSMADELMFDLFAEIAKDHIEKQWRSGANLKFKMKNGRIVRLAGCDKPKSLRGGSLIALVLDECQDIVLPEVWDRVLRPACGDLKAPVLFIGTPLPETNPAWTELYRRGQDESNKQWESIHCNSTDNPFIDMQAEIDQARQDGVSEAVIQQEFFASFDSVASCQFPLDNIPTYETVPEGSLTFVTFDLQGFSDLSGLSIKEIKRLDRTAIVAVSIGPDAKWYVRQVKFGRWEVEETAGHIADFIKRWTPLKVGCEKGMLKNAIGPYLKTALKKRNIFMQVTPLSSLGTSKQNRILWALQGRFEQNMIVFPKDRPEWIKELVKELLGFPATAVHDDGPDALAMIDQFSELAPVNTDYDEWDDMDDTTDFEPIDELTGY